MSNDDDKRDDDERDDDKRNDDKRDDDERDDDERDDDERDDDERDDEKRDDEKRDDEKRDESDSDETNGAEASNENASDETEEDDTAAPASSSSEGASGEGAAPPTASSGAAAKGGRMSAGARLAAAKAAKAVVKAAKKEERKAASAQTEVVQEQAQEAATAEAAPDPVKELEESELGRAALKAGRWWESNQQMGWIAVAAAAIAIVGFLGWQYREETTSAAAGTLLEEAIEIASARIESPDAADEASEDEDEDADEERTFPTRTARDEAALEAYEAVRSQYPGHPSAGIARLGAARTLLALGRNDEAREMYQEALDRDGGRSGTIAWQALEGIGFAQEAAGNADEARATYERLGDLDGHSYEQVANYHLARLMLARGERDEARTALRELVDALRAETVEDSSEPRFPYLLAQAEVRLRELDPSSATSAGPQLLGPGGGAAGGGPGGGGGDIDPEQLQELIRQFQAQQQGGAGGGGE